MGFPGREKPSVEVGKEGKCPRAQGSPETVKASGTRWSKVKQRTPANVTGCRCPSLLLSREWAWNFHREGGSSGREEAAAGLLLEAVRRLGRRWTQG